MQRQARADELFQRDYPHILKAAQNGDAAALQKMRELQFTVGVTSENIDKKIRVATRALSRARQASPVDPDQIKAIESAIQSLKNQELSLKWREMFGMTHY